MERTTRFRQALEFLEYRWDSAMANVVPLVNRYVETLNGQRAPTDFRPRLACRVRVRGYSSNRPFLSNE
jgi:hypothetical protein